ncbi:RNA polymerase subunit sigma-24 [Aeromicrobium sp. Root495]|uniref:RNA polymerase sigma factor n=1 Tax=Aeromicrobium sp. Root495 TaxID=1736550 RepID=UPI0006F21C83|nr:sigma-70 family RNA polymerase sigma factor [Aeromicrobium sp. Root495]KQY60808.1 RNA polymerase subunit sigma-24 [Aeromicrobium sp. Root495]RYI99032.1 MAG: sigma-70 family RNA polymerase sigma factor [Actinomycetales bacterium]
MDDDAALLERAQAGERGAFAALYTRHVRAVYWQAYGRLGDADLSEEVTQEVFVTAWRRIRTVHVVDASVLPWLMVTARNLAMNQVRRRSRPDRSTIPLDDTSPADHDVEATVEAALVRQEIEKAVGQLSSTDRRLYELCLEEGRSYDQAARELGVTQAAVRNRLSRLRQRLRADLRAMRELS